MPYRLDDTPVPGIPGTIGYLHSRSDKPDEVVKHLIEKIRTAKAAASSSTPTDAVESLATVEDATLSSTSTDAVESSLAEKPQEPTEKPPKATVPPGTGSTKATAAIGLVALLVIGAVFTLWAMTRTQPVVPPDVGPGSTPAGPPPQIRPAGTGELDPGAPDAEPDQPATETPELVELTLVLSPDSVSSSVFIDGQPADVVNVGERTLTVRVPVGYRMFTLVRREDQQICEFPRDIEASTLSLSPPCLWGPTGGPSPRTE
ncbi:MAG: hypothetical protein AAFX50_23680 [Acidobacteriota bacterium]